jgi:oxaloacetate decarboxylase alpha subunit
MAHIDFLDETMRDGQQSLWGLRMRAGMALPVSPLLDRTGFSTIDLTGGGMLDVLTRYCQENYWEGLDLLVASMPNTPLRAGLRANANVTFGITPPVLMDLWVKRLCAHGIRSFWIYDVLFGLDNMLRLARVAKEANGAKVAGAIMFAPRRCIPTSFLCLTPVSWPTAPMWTRSCCMTRPGCWKRTVSSNWCPRW